jgi:elongation factor G
MESKPQDKVRNIAVLGHSGSGKTTLMEAALFLTGAIERMGSTDDGSTVSDFDPEEIKRSISVNASVIPVSVGDGKTNFLDTPGYSDFVGDVIGACAVCDTAVLVTPANSGIEVGFDNAWEIADDHSLGRVIIVNKMDRENADFGKLLSELTERFGNKAVPLLIPVGAEAGFSGVVDVIAERAYTLSGKQSKEGEIPSELTQQAKTYKEALTEFAVEGEDELMEKYLDGGEISKAELLRGLRKSVARQRVFPVLACSAKTLPGVREVIGSLYSICPSPGESRPSIEGTKPQSEDKVRRKCDDSESFSAQVFKSTADPYVGRLTYFRVFSGALRPDSQVHNSTKGKDERVGQIYFVRGKEQQAATAVGVGDIGAVAKLQHTTTGDTLCDKAEPIVLRAIEFPRPTYSIAIAPRSKADEDKLGSGISRLLEEDPTFAQRRDPETGQTLIMGMGETHLDIMVERLKRKFGAEVDTLDPKIPYHETVQTTAKAQGRHKKQTGGRGQFGDCWVEVEPLPRGGGFEFVDKIVGGAIPRQFILAVEKGIVEAMKEGIVAGFPVVDVRTTLYDGSFHTVDSSEIAFKIAGSLAFKSATSQARPILLEPVLNVEVVVPESYTGDIISDFNGKRGRVQGMEPMPGGRQKIVAAVPQAEMLKYSIDLRSITRGRGRFSTELSHYEEVPAQIQQQIVERNKKESAEK